MARSTDQRTERVYERQNPSRTYVLVAPSNLKASKLHERVRGVGRTSTQTLNPPYVQRNSLNLKTRYNVRFITPNLIFVRLNSKKRKGKRGGGKEPNEKKKKQ